MSWSTDCSLQVKLHLRVASLGGGHLEQLWGMLHYILRPGCPVADTQLHLVPQVQCAPAAVGVLGLRGGLRPETGAGPGVVWLRPELLEAGVLGGGVGVLAGWEVLATGAVLLGPPSLL